MASTEPLRISRPSRFTPDMRVCAVKGTNTASCEASSRPRRLYCSFASTTIERPSGVSSASDESWAASAISAAVIPGAGMNSAAWRFPSVIVPVLSSSNVFTSPAASTARPDIASTLCCTRRSMPAMPIAESRPPIVVGIRQTSRETSTNTVCGDPEYIAKGCRVTTASRKMMVRPASRMLSAISFGVFCRSAPSTKAIILSRKVSPGFEGMRTLITSESTRVPPVTADRSPPASRITGADSPVIADSSTEATPSMISPSPGISSFAATITTSPERSFALGTVSTVPFGSKRLATVSDRAFRSVSACALPRPSAMASAKFANSTVNQSQSVICKLNAKLCFSRNNSAVVTTLPTSTTNITGFFIMVRGSSLTTASTSARRIILASHNLLLFLSAMSCLRSSASESFPCHHLQMFKYGSQTKRREKCERSHDHNHRYQQNAKQGRSHRERTRRGGDGLFLRQVACDGQHGNNHEEAPHQHRHCARRVVPKRVTVQSPECGAVVSRHGRERVEDLGQAVWTRIADARCAESLDRRNGREHQNDQWENQRDQHRHLHVVSFNLLAEILRRSPNHKPGNKHRQNHIDQDSVQARAHSSENGLAEHDVDERHHATQRCKRIMPAVDRTAARIGGDGRKQRGIGDAKADFLAFHVPAGLQRRGMLVDSL